MTTRPRVAIVGAGVAGLTTAASFAERGYEPVIFADRMPRETTSAVAAAIWFPYDAEPEHLVTAWSLMTYGRLVELMRDPDSGVSLIEFRVLSRGNVPPWADAIGYRRIDGGYAVNVPLMETPVYLPYLETRVRNAGGIFERVQLERIEDIPDQHFAAIVNCSGYGARALVPDHDVKAHRGQVLVAPKSDRRFASVREEPLTYVIPRRDATILGGVNAESASLDVDAEATAAIVQRCAEEGIVASRDCVALTGIRPFRATGVRLEADRTSDGRLLIHNYGHGGCGFSVSWGCAQKVFELARIRA